MSLLRQLAIELAGEELGDLLDRIQQGWDGLRASPKWGALKSFLTLFFWVWVLLLVWAWVAHGSGGFFAVVASTLVLVVLIARSIPKGAGAARRRIDRSRWPQAKIAIDRAIGVLFPGGDYNPSDDGHRKRVEALAKKMPGTDPLSEKAIEALVAQGYPVHPVD